MLHKQWRHPVQTRQTLCSPWSKSQGIASCSLASWRKACVCKRPKPEKWLLRAAYRMQPRHFMFLGRRKLALSAAIWSSFFDSTLFRHTFKGNMRGNHPLLLWVPISAKPQYPMHPQFTALTCLSTVRSQKDEPCGLNWRGFNG